MKSMFRDYYNEVEAHMVSDLTGLKCLDKSKTRQSDADSADINLLLEKMKVGYELPTNVRMPQYGDFEYSMNFEESMNAVRAAQVSFDLMPAKVRAEFVNDPQRFLDFCEERDSDGKRVNLDRMVKLGLAVPPEATPEPSPMLVRVVSDKPPEAA